MLTNGFPGFSHDFKINFHDQSSYEISVYTGVYLKWQMNEKNTYSNKCLNITHFHDFSKHFGTFPDLKITILKSMTFPSFPWPYEPCISVLAGRISSLVLFKGFVDYISCELKLHVWAADYAHLTLCALTLISRTLAGWARHTNQTYYQWIISRLTWALVRCWPAYFECFYQLKDNLRDWEIQPVGH